MITGIGIDSVEIDRFDQWHAYSHKTLRKVFTPHEIEYCLSIKTLSAQRFAARFAVKEAAFKAWTQAAGCAPTPFIPWLACVETTIIVAPVVNIDKPEASNYSIWCSITHTQQVATALVIIEIVDKQGFTKL